MEAKRLTGIWVALLASILTLGNVSGQKFSLGSCPEVETVKNFDIQKYSGRWYEYSNYFAFFQVLGKCVTADYTDQTVADQPAKINVLNRAVNTVTGSKDKVDGTAVLNDPEDPTKPGELIVNFDSQLSRLTNTKATSTNYNVIGTDYDNFAIVYSCDKKLFGKTELLWLLTREREPSQELVDEAYELIKEMGIDTGALEKTDQSECPEPTW